jgi:hydroxypyruvate reductase
MSHSSHRQILSDIFDAAIAACHPRHVVPRHLPKRTQAQRIIIAAGKAAAAMARAVEDHWGPPLDGLVVARHGFECKLDYLELITARHPVPDDNSVVAATRLFSLVRNAPETAEVLLLLSGGASALLAAPAQGFTLKRKAELTRALLASGAAISEINCVRRHLSSVKGGRLAAACPGQFLTLAISDVIGDIPFDIGSGPGVGDPTTIDDARAILARYTIADHDFPWSESIKPNDPRLSRASFRLVACAGDLISAAMAHARLLGFRPINLGTEIAGDAATVARDQAKFALEALRQGERCALISGGELTVTLGPGSTGLGVGGPNQEFALSLATALGGRPGISALAADTDGIDGVNDAAGAFIDPSTFSRAAALGLDLDDALARHDSGGAFARLGDLFQPGPTLTNVNDLRVILIEPDITG